MGVGYWVWPLAVRHALLSRIFPKEGVRWWCLRVPRRERPCPSVISRINSTGLGLVHCPRPRPREGPEMQKYTRRGR